MFILLFIPLNGFLLVQVFNTSFLTVEINLVEQISQPKDKDLKTILFKNSLCYNAESAGASPRSVTVTTDIVFWSMQSQMINIW